MAHNLRPASETGRPLSADADENSMFPIDQGAVPEKVTVVKSSIDNSARPPESGMSSTGTAGRLVAPSLAVVSTLIMLTLTIFIWSVAND